MESPRIPSAADGIGNPDIAVLETGGLLVDIVLRQRRNEGKPKLHAFGDVSRLPEEEGHNALHGTCICLSTTGDNFAYVDGGFKQRDRIAHKSSPAFPIKLMPICSPRWFLRNIIHIQKQVRVVFSSV